jgi:hypothetical protein
VGLPADQLLRERSCPIDVAAAPPNVHPYIAALGRVTSVGIVITIKEAAGTAARGDNALATSS